MATPDNVRAFERVNLPDEPPAQDPALARAANAAAIAALQATIANGGTVSAADLSTLEGNTAAIIAATGSLTAALNPPPTPPGPVTS